MIDNLKFWSAAFLVLAVIVFLGWREPLRYRLMSRAEIEAEMRGMVDPTPNWMWSPGRRTKLDERPTRVRATSKDSR